MYIVFKFRETLPEKDDTSQFSFAVAVNELELLEPPVIMDKLPEGVAMNRRTTNDAIFHYYIDAGTNDRRALENILNDFQHEFAKCKYSSEPYTSPSRHPAVYRIEQKIAGLPNREQGILKSIASYATSRNLLFAGAAVAAVYAAAQYYRKNNP